MINQAIQTTIDTATELLNDARNFFESSDYNESEYCCNEVLAMLEPESERNDLGEELDKTSQKYAVIGLLAHAYNRLNLISLARSDYALALSQAETALQFCERIGNLTRKADLIGNIGLVHSDLSDYPKALEYFGKAVSIAEEIGNKVGVTIHLGNIGNVHFNLSDYPKALEYHGSALGIAEELGNKAGVAIHLGNIGTVHGVLSDYPKALEYFGKALSIAEELSNKAGVAVSLGNIGATYATLKYEGFDAVKAEEYLLKASDIATEIGAKAHLGYLHTTLSKLYEHEKRLGDAFEHYKKYIAIEKELNIEEVKKQESIREHRKAIELAKATADAKHQATQELLHNVLPPIIANRMLEGEKLIAEKLPSVSVLFADIVNFTKLSQRITPEELVEGLDGIFSTFDTLAVKHGLEKIKTIGDAYMVVSGAPIQRTDHAEAIANFAIEMVEAIQQFRSISTGEEIQLRIGIHSGEVVAGVIGKKKFAYDLWGDAVNTAARMESHSEPNKIHVSEDFVNAAGNNFSFLERGEMDIKGKGLMRTYFLEKAN